MCPDAPTPASLLRRELALRAAAAYAANRSVIAVVLGGSAADGHADRYSDLELFVVWKRPPTDAERRSAIEVAGGDLVRLYAAEEDETGVVWSDAWKIGRRDDVPFTGVEVDMHHVLAEDVDRTLADVVDASDPSLAKQNVVGGLLHAIPLHGGTAVADWQERAASYPDALRLAVLRAHAPIEGLWQLDAFAVRANPIRGYAVLTQVHEQLLHALLALNRRYYTGFRSLDAVAADLPIAPRDLVARIHAAYPLVFGSTKQAVAALVEETYDLVEEHVPELPVDRWRVFLRYERPLWETAR
jgi:predicted nucleotidyltransferase